jgi:hypothetical protein
MNPMNHRSAKTQADLQKLVEPLADYIAAVDQPQVVLMAALILLLDNLREINEAANDCLALFSKKHVA